MIQLRGLFLKDPPYNVTGTCCIGFLAAVRSVPLQLDPVVQSRLLVRGLAPTANLEYSVNTLSNSVLVSTQQLMQAYQSQGFGNCRHVDSSLTLLEVGCMLLGEFQPAEYDCM
jgi:hypothetical protein